MAIVSINPATGETLKTFQPISDKDVDQKILLGVDTFRRYRTMPFDQRSRLMNRLAQILEAEKTDLGKLMTTEMGKTLASAIQEAEKCALACRFFAENAEKFLADEVVQTNATLSYVHYQPLGPILAIMPWNFPFWQVLRFAAPAIMAGNVVLLKHAPTVSQCALKIEELFRRAGFPDGVLQTLLVEVEQIPRILEDPNIKAVTLTGSVRAGSYVGGIAGKAIKKIVLELGGSDPFIVMPSANITEAARVAVTARTINNGQSCIAAKRFIVHEQVYDEFTKRFIDGMKSLNVGNPMDESTDIGPIAREDLLDNLDHQVQKSQQMGAHILLGGQRLRRSGFFYVPTILSNIPKDSPAYKEELFGPVASLFKVHDLDEAILLANSTNFGLGSAAWTTDEHEKSRFIDELESGAVFINGMVVSDPRLPFGGVKNSGYGRELGVHGIREFTNTKTVWYKK